MAIYTYHLNFHQSFVAIIEQITRLSTINSDNAEEKLAAKAERHRCLTLVNDCADTTLDVRLQDIAFR